MKVTQRRADDAVERKFLVAFSAMFVIPMLLSAYLFTEYVAVVTESASRLTLLSMFVALLGAAGFILSRAVVKALLRTARDAEAIARGTWPDASTRTWTGGSANWRGTSTGSPAACRPRSKGSRGR